MRYVPFYVYLTHGGIMYIIGAFTDMKSIKASNIIMLTDASVFQKEKKKGNADIL